jgi:hypothetical protein
MWFSDLELDKLKKNNNRIRVAGLKSISDICGSLNKRIKYGN